MASFKAVCVLFMCIMVAAPLIVTDAAMTCPKLEEALAPCLPYLKQGGTPVKGCCDGVKTMVSTAKTTVDRQGACKCLKTVAGTIQGINPGYAASLPSQCGVNIPYKISTSTNCASVK